MYSLCWKNISNSLLFEDPNNNYVYEGSVFLDKTPLQIATTVPNRPSDFMSQKRSFFAATNVRPLVIPASFLETMWALYNVCIKIQFGKISRLHFMFCWRCVSIHQCNENQLDALFILSLFRQSTSTCFGHICSLSSGDILYRVIRKSLRDFRTRLHNNQDRHGRKEHISR